MVLLFPDALLYQERYEPKQLLLYIAEKKDERLEHHTQLVEELFLPISHRLRVFGRFPEAGRWSSTPVLPGCSSAESPWGLRRG